MTEKTEPKVSSRASMAGPIHMKEPDKYTQIQMIHAKTAFRE